MAKDKKEKLEKSQEEVKGKTKPLEDKTSPGSEKLVLEEEEKRELPPFPPERKGKRDLFSPVISEGEEGEGDFEAIDIEEFCKDIANIPFEIWHIVNPEVEPLSAKEKKLIGKPLSRVVVKYDLQKYAKDELVLFAFLSFSVLGRLKKSKRSPEKEAPK